MKGVSQRVPRLPDHACVRLIGLGGVGGAVARFGSMFLASLDAPCRMLLIDGDQFEPANSGRMFFAQQGNKAAVTHSGLVERFAGSSLTLIAIEQFITPQNIERLLGGSSEGNIILLAVDNHATRKLVSDYCLGLSDICLISGGNDGIGVDSSGRPQQGTFGTCQIHLRRGGRDLSPPLTRFHPEIVHPQDKLPSDLGCTELAASVPQILFTNLATASAMLNTLWLHLCEELPYPELCFDIALGKMSPVPLPMRPARVAMSG